MERKTGIVLSKQYATYQVCIDIYSKQITTEEVFKKAFLYIMEWLKGRIGAQLLQQLPELKKYPEPSAYKEFNIKDMFGFKLLSEMDIRLFNFEEENSWAMRITEPDNRAEFNNGAMADSLEISGRSFITEVALHKNDRNVTLAIQIICKEPKANVRDALSFRPAFVKSLFKDNEMEMVESGISSMFRFRKSYDEKGAIQGEPILIDNSNADDFVREVMLNARRQMPIILCPESVYEMTYPSMGFVDGKSIEEERNINSLAYSLMGYAHVVVISKKVVDAVFDNKKLRCLEYAEELLEDCVIFHRGFNEDSGLPEEPIYCSLVDEEDVPDDEEFLSKNPLKIMEEQAKKYSVRKMYSFAPAMFYRELKKQFYKYEGKSDTAAAIKNLESDIAEKDALILDLRHSLSQNERESKKRVDELKSKFDNSQLSYFTYKAKYEEAQKQIDSNEQRIEKIKEDYENIIRQKELMIRVFSGKEIPEPDEERLQVYRKETTPNALLQWGDRFEDELTKRILKKEVLKKLHRMYWDLESKEVSKKNKIRRFELLEIVLQYSKYLEELGYPSESLLYYPSGIEFYPGEIKDVILDILYGESEDDELLEYLLEVNDFDFAQDTKKSEIFNEINSYRHHKSIKGTLERVGLVLKASKDHYIYSYYGDERYKFTVSGSTSDTNAGKNLAEDIIERCL